MERLFWIALPASVLLASTAMADPGPDTSQLGFYGDGDIELEYSFSDDATSTARGTRIDARVGYHAWNTGQFGIGAEAAMQYSNIPGVATLDSLSAIVYAQSSLGTFSLGAPTAVSEDFGPETVFDRSVIGTFLHVGANIGPQVANQAYDGFVPGVRFDGEHSGVTYALSYHDYPNSGGVNGLSMAASYDYGFVTISGETAVLQAASGSVRSYSLAADADLGAMTASFEFTSTDVLTGLRVVTIDGSYQVTDALTVSAGRREYDLPVPGPDSAWLLEAEYNLSPSAYVSASAGQTFGISEANIGIGLEF